MEETIILDGIRAICAALDKIIYGIFIPMLYDFIVQLSEINPFEETAVSDFATRVYSLLALFMLFRISFSFITYIVNPEEMVEKTKGAGSIVKNVIIVLILIIICPRAFSLLRQAQSAIITDNILPNFILGVDSSDTNNAISLQYYNNTNGYCPGDSGQMKAESTGDYISLMILRNFYNIDTESYKGEAGADKADLDTTEFCNFEESATAKALLSDGIYNLAPGYNAKYVMDYWIIISTVVGVGVALILLSFCFDIAVRSIKLGFLEIISPIPIISYLEPNSAKSGMFKKWLSEVGKTWANLFIRLAAIFFAVFVISQLEVLKLADKYDNGFFVELFILIGALIFAKQLPNLIEKLVPGLQMKGSFEVNPFKKVANEAVGGKLLVGGAAAAAGTGVGLAAYGSYKVADRIKNGSKNRLETAQKRLDIAKNRLERNPTLANEKRNDKAERRLEKAQTKFEKHEERSQFFKDAKASAADKFNLEDIKLGKVYGTAKSLKTGVVQVKDAAVEGYNQGKGLKFKPLDIGEKSSKQRSYKEEYNLGDRVKDKFTDFAGIKNESGTTSEVKKRIEEQNQILERINRNIEIASRSFSDLQTRMGSEFTQAITWNDNGKIEINPTYNGDYKDELLAHLNLRNDLEEQQHNAKKELNRLTKIRDKKGKKE